MLLVPAASSPMASTAYICTAFMLILPFLGVINPRLLLRCFPEQLKLDVAGRRYHRYSSGKPKLLLI